MKKNFQNDLIIQQEKNIQNRNSDIELLTDMGFEKTMINKVYLSLKPQNVENAINYMIERNGKYQHKFIQSKNPNEQNLCFICQKPRQNHLNFQSENLISYNPTENSITNLTKNSESLKQDTSFININNDNILDECKVCYGKINSEDKELNQLKCGHLFCKNCWFDYLKHLIEAAKVDRIKCMENGCKVIISEDFILNHISEDENLIEKYKKFKKRAKIIKDKEKKICPNPNCDSFLQKSNSTKYVKCEYGHEYCFECLNPPHENKPCNIIQESKFMNWTKDKKVKRCPNCKIYIQKNLGCNHMVCINCDYQWCWICEEEYKSDHYLVGKCRGLQEADINDLEYIEKYRNFFGLHKIFACFFPPIYGPVDFPVSIKEKYLYISLFWLFGYGILYTYIIMFTLLNEEAGIESKMQRKIGCFSAIILFFGLVMLIPFQFLFTLTITPFILISFIYHNFFGILLMFYGIGSTAEDIFNLN